MAHAWMMHAERHAEPEAAVGFRGIIGFMLMERCTFLTHLGSFQVRISGPVFGIPTGDNSEPCPGHFRRTHGAFQARCLGFRV